MNQDNQNQFPQWCKQNGNAVVLSVKLQPRASKNRIVLTNEKSGAFLKISVTAPPVESAANEALIKYLAETFDYPKSSIQIIKGGKSRLKAVVIYGTTLDELLKKIKSLSSDN